MKRITVIHTRTCSFYREEPEQAFGFCGRAAYALGHNKPNYPVPATLCLAETFQWLDQGDFLKAAAWQSSPV